MYPIADKTEQDIEREQSLVDQWVSLTEERNAVLVPAAGSGIPGAPADWTPPAGMEPHIPVLFLDLNGIASFHCHVTLSEKTRIMIILLRIFHWKLIHFTVHLRHSWMFRLSEAKHFPFNYFCNFV